MLVNALSRHESALRASLMAEYKIRLVSGGRGTTQPQLPIDELADLVAWLPRGCALGRAMGGASAISDEAELGMRIMYDLDILVWKKTKDGQDGRNPPKPPEYPRPPGEVAAEAKRDDDAWERGARAFQRRQRQAAMR